MSAQQIALTDCCTGQGRLLGIADDVNGKALPDQFIGQCGVGDAADGQDHCVSGDLLVVFTGNDDRVVCDLLHRGIDIGPGAVVGQIPQQILARSGAFI